MYTFASKLWIVFFVSYSSLISGYVTASDINEVLKDSSSIHRKRDIQERDKTDLNEEPQELAKKASEQKTKSKKARIEEGEDEEEEEEGDQAGETTVITSGRPARKSAEIGIWVGDKDKGIESLQLLYKETLISDDIIRWHCEKGQQLKDIIALRGADKDKTNYIRARLDFVYKEENLYKIIGQEIPVLFISGHSNKGAKKAVLELQENIGYITTDPCIPINSYFGWSDLGEEDYAPIRDIFMPLFEEAGVKDQVHPSLREEQRESLESSNKPAFQYWLHSEEPLIFFFLGKEARTVDNEILVPFSEIMRNIKLPEDIVPELCILSMMSRNDCCTHCRPLILEATQHREFLEKSIIANLKTAPSSLKKVLLYSALNQFQINRPEDGYIASVKLDEDKDSVLFLMAGNEPGEKN